MSVENCVVADVGGTHIRFGLSANGDGPLQCVEIYQCSEFEQINDAIDFYVSKQVIAQGFSLDALCLAVPGPTHQKVITLVNSPWVINQVRLAYQFNCPVALINDFTAQAYCLPRLQEHELCWLQSPELPDHTPTHIEQTKLVVGPGTGLGVAALLPNNSVVESEGGHLAFAPTSPLQIEILRYASHFFPRVSVERLVSGPGLALLYHVLCEIHGKSDNPMISPQVVTEQAKNGDELCLQAIHEFTAIFGAVCGDLTLAMGAAGGVYLSGGVLDKLGDLFDPALFLKKFQSKGRFSEYCGLVPVAKILVDYPGLLGAAYYAKSERIK